MSFGLLPEQEFKLNLMRSHSNLSQLCSWMRPETEFGGSKVLNLLTESRNQSFWKYNDGDFLRKRWPLWSEESCANYHKNFRSNAGFEIVVISYHMYIL